MKALSSQAFPTLSSKRLHLRKPRSKDAAKYHLILSCPELTVYSDLPPNPDKKRSERFVSWMSKLQTRGTGVAWIIEEKASESVIGAIRINSIEKKAMCGVIGYEIHPDFWSRGFATEALQLVVSYAHNSLKLNRLEAWTVVGNHASDKVLVKNHFVHEGVQRDKARFNGELHTVNLWGRLASDKMPI